MRIFLSLIIPLALLFAPLVWQIILSIRRIRHHSRLSLMMIFMLAFISECVFSFVAPFFASLGLSDGLNPNEPNCINGILTFPFLGIIIAAVIMPLTVITIAAIQYIKYKNKQY